MSLLRKPLPRVDLPTTDAANVIENIDNWIAKGNYSKLEQVCRPEFVLKNHRGYRFVTAEDFKEIHQWFIIVGGIKVMFYMVRHYYNDDKFNPFWFGVLREDISFKVYETVEWYQYKTDAQVKRIAKEYKETLKKLQN